MKEKQKNELKVGITVLFGIAILLYGFFQLKEWSVSAEYPLTIRFSTSAGLQKGDVVSINGVKSGKVESVVIDGNSILARVLLSEDIRLTSDAKASIQMLELMGGKKIEIMQGSSLTLLDRSKIMTGTVEPDIAGALSIVGDVKGDVVQLSSNANKLLINLNKLLGDEELHSSVKSSFANLNQTMVELKGMIAENRANTKKITENLSNLTAELDTLAKESRPKITTTLDRTASTLAQTDTLFSEIKLLLRDVKQGQGFLHQALYDSTFSMRIDSLMGRLNKVMEVLLDNGVKVRIRL